METLNTISDPAEVMDPGFLLDLHAYWIESREGKSVPDRRDIDPADIPAILPHVYLVDVLPGGEFHVRLIGTNLVQRFGCDPTGQKVSDVLPDPYLDYAHSVLNAAVSACNPVFCESSYSVPGKEFLRVRRLILPLTNKGSDIAMLLVGQQFLSPDRKPSHDYLAVIELARHHAGEHAIISDQHAVQTLQHN